MAVISNKIESKVDDHVFIMIEREERPTVSIDVYRDGQIGVRVNGYGIFNAFLDVERVHGNVMFKEEHRYCPMCGQELQLFSSRAHQCPKDK